jgi:hypothetical protein
LVVVVLHKQRLVMLEILDQVQHFLQLHLLVVAVEAVAVLVKMVYQEVLAEVVVNLQVLVELVVLHLQAVKEILAVLVELDLLLEVVEVVLMPLELPQLVAMAAMEEMVFHQVLQGLL